MRIPHRLAVVMRVDIDEAWRDRQARGVNLFRAAAGYRAHVSDLAVFDGDVGGERCAAVAVHHGAAADDDVEFTGHGRCLFLPVGSSVYPRAVGGKSGRRPEAVTSGRGHVWTRSRGACLNETASHHDRSRRTRWAPGAPARSTTTPPWTGCTVW